MTTILDRMHTALTTLRLSEEDALLEAYLERAVQDGRTYGECLCDLLEAELEARSVHVLHARMRMAGFPYTKSLSQFNFSSLDAVIDSLCDGLQELTADPERVHSMISFPHVRSIS